MVNGNPCWIIDAPTVSAVAFLVYSTQEQRDECEPDAKLLSAAPDMAEALRLIAETASAAEWASDIDTARKRLDRIYAAARGARAKAGL